MYRKEKKRHENKPREGGGGRRGHAEVFRKMVSVSHPEGAHEAHRQERDLPTGLRAGGHRWNAGHVSLRGKNVPKHDAATTTEGLKEVAKLVLKRDGGGRLSREEKRRLAELDKDKIAVMKDREGGPILHQRSRF